MEVLKRLLIFLDSDMTRPHSYGSFHMLFLFLLFAVIIFVAFKYKGNEKKGKQIILILSIVSILLECYKQVNFSFHYSNISTWWEYQWYAFPFQFCSTPMYVGLLASIIKNNKLKEILYMFLAIYGIIGGVITMFYPETCFVSTIGINIQTMVHHASMVIMGITVPICMNIKFNLKSFINSTLVFIVLVFIAVFINVSTYYIGINGGLEMFYISPFHNCSLPILSVVDENLSYFFFLLLYIFSFMVIAFGIFKIIIMLKNKSKL